MASHKRKIMDDATRRVLADHSIVRYTLETTAGNHGRVRFWVGGRQGNVIYPSTASDHRSLANHVAFMRREIRRLALPEDVRAAA